jgi:hypothetical protein
MGIKLDFLIIGGVLNKGWRVLFPPKAEGPSLTHRMLPFGEILKRRY